MRAMTIRWGRFPAWILVSAWLTMTTAMLQAQVATTTVQDTIYYASGVPAQGTLLISWPAFTAIGGVALAAGSTSATLTSSGGLSVALAPNAGSIPVGSYYTVVYHLNDGSVFQEYWVVPVSMSPVRLTAVKSTVLPTSVAMQTVTKAYVDSAIRSVAASGIASPDVQDTGGFLYFSKPATFGFNSTPAAGILAAFGTAGQTTVDQSGNVKAASVGVNGLSYNWPSAQRTGALTNDGSGHLSWATSGADFVLTSNGSDTITTADGNPLVLDNDSNGVILNPGDIPDNYANTTGTAANVTGIVSTAHLPSNVAYTTAANTFMANQSLTLTQNGLTMYSATNANANGQALFNANSDTSVFYFGAAGSNVAGLGGYVNEHSGPQLSLLYHDAQVVAVTGAGIAVTGDVSLSGRVAPQQATPGSSSASCAAGQMWTDASYIYVCTAANTIKRAALSSF